MTGNAYRRPATFALLASLAAGLLAACDDAPGEQANETATPAELDPVIIATTQVVREDLVVPVTGTGTIAAERTTDIGPRVDGIVEEVYVWVGDRVTKGQPLFRTRDSELRLRVTELEGQVALSSAELRNATRDLERTRQLQKKGIASVGNLDDTQAAYAIAKARKEIAEAQLAQAKQMFDDTIVTAPFDGVITRRDVNEGKFMATRMGGGMMGGASGVVQIMKIDVVAAIVEVPEVHLPKLALGTPAKIYVDGLDREFEAKIHVINDRVEPLSRSVEVRVALPNPDYAIKPGLFTRAEFYPEPRSALLLDRAAILGFGEQRYVFAEQDGKATRLPVEIRQLDALRVEVLAGLDEGATVLVGPNLPNLIEGSPVTLSSDAHLSRLSISRVASR